MGRYADAVAKYTSVRKQNPQNALEEFMMKQDIQSRNRAAEQDAKNEAIWERQFQRQSFQQEQNYLKNQMSQQLVEKKAKLGESTARRKSLDTYMGDANQALVALEKIEKGAKKLGDFNRGAIPQLGAKISMGFKKFSKDEDVTRYLGVLAQELIPMARKLMEEKGPITESDVKRVEMGFGDLTTPLKDKIFLINELKGKVKQSLEMKMGLVEQDAGQELPEEYGSVLQRASNTSQEIDPNDWEAREQQLRSRFLKKRR